MLAVGDGCLSHRPGHLTGPPVSLYLSTKATSSGSVADTATLSSFITHFPAEWHRLQKTLSPICATFGKLRNNFASVWPRGDIREGG